MGWSANAKKTKEIIETFNDIRLMDHIDVYQECTCKMDKSLNRGMLNKFESRKICVAGYQCDNRDFDYTASCL